MEIMSRTDVDQVRNSEDREFIGFAHLAFSTGSKDQVDRLTDKGVSITVRGKYEENPIELVFLSTITTG